MFSKKMLVLTTYLVLNALPTMASTSDLQRPINTGANAATLKDSAQVLTLEGSVSCSVLSATEGSFIASSPNASCKMISEDTLVLENGTVLLSTRSQTKVTTEVGEVHMKGNAQALVSLQDGKLYVVNLATSREENLSVVVGQRVMFPTLGMQLIVSDSRTSFKQVFRNKRVGQLGIATEQLDSSTWITTSDVSLAELLVNEPVLVAVTRDKESKEGQKVMKGLAKAAACVNAVAGDRSFSHLKG